MISIKDLNCVELKNKIQAELLEEYRRLSPKEIRNHLQQKLETSNSIAAKFWRQMEEAKHLKKVG